nr:hypothetical protein [Fimbriiglobus ruber]
MPEDDHLVEGPMSLRERDYTDLLIVPRQVLTGTRVFLDDIFWADQSHHTTRHEPFGRSPEKLFLDPLAAVAVIEGWVQPDEREAAEAHAAPEDVGRSQNRSVRQCCVKHVRSAVVQFNGMSQGLWASKQFAELPNGRSSTGTRIEDRERFLGRWLLEGSSKGDSVLMGWIEPAFNLSRQSHGLPR